MGPYIALVIVIGIVFGICYLVDKGFTRLFRGKAQHNTGKSVRLNKKFGSIGLIVAVVGVGGLFAGLGSNWLLFAGGWVLILVGFGLVVYYMSFGIYYDADSFIYSSFTSRSTVYKFSQITGQQLYTSAAGVLIELYLDDGKTVQLQPGMTGVDAFMDHAFAAWLQQAGKTVEGCDFYDPANSCWFPPVK